jgi:hypothetical protein
MPDTPSPKRAPIEPSKEALEAAREAYRQGKYHNDVIGEFALTLDRFRTAGVREGIKKTISVIENGRFLHDDAPPARFAKEVVAAIRRELLGASP